MSNLKYTSPLGILLLISLIISPAFAQPGESIRYSQIEAGTLIIATDKLNRTDFQRAVIYVTEHSEHGTHGVIINKPTPMFINEAMPDSMQVKNPSHLYFGGPMHAQFLFILTKDGKHQNLHNVVNGLYFGAGDQTMIELNSQAHDQTRTFIGFTSWGPGQLDKELEHEVWLVAPGSVKDVFDEHPETLWKKLSTEWSGDWT